MKQKKLKFKHKKQIHEITVITFETIAEAHNTLGDEMLKVINYSCEQLARLKKIGIDPFAVKKKKFKLDITKIDEKTLEMLKESGAIEG